MKITFFGTTTLLFDDGKTQILFDAHFSRPSILKMLFGKLRTDEVLVQSYLSQFSINRLSGIFVSHTHYDHVLDAPFVAKCTGAQIFGSVSALNVARGGGIAEEKMHLFAQKMPIQLGDFTVTPIQSLHSRAKWFNNDLGIEILEPLHQPQPRRAYTEGGSWDFLVEHRDGQRFIIRPSFHFLPGELDFLAGKKVDALFLGIAGLARATPDFRRAFFAQTVEKARAKNVIPVHWDDFFRSLIKPVRPLPALVDDIPRAFLQLSEACQKTGSALIVQIPFSSIYID